MPAEILKPTPENLALAAEAILRGEVVAIPTETVYGLAGDALNPLALARIFETKERPTFDPLIVHVGFQAKRVSQLEEQGLVDGKKLSRAAREIADRLMEKFWPGPLTLILPKTERVPDLATSGLPTVALRMPRHSVAQALIAASGRALAAPSANRFGRISPTTSEHVKSELGGRIDWILDGGACEIGVESTIISISTSGSPGGSPSGSDDGELTLLRPGGLALEEIEAAVGRQVQKRDPKCTNETGTVLAPGMLESHYAPRKALFLLPASLEQLKSFPDPLREALTRGKAGVLSVLTPEARARALFRELSGVDCLCRSLTESGDLNEAARNLFQRLRALDESDVSVIFSEPCPVQSGLGYAIGDRLRRASNSSST